MMGDISLLLAIISILLVVLSVYSAISMDTVSRQKEVAIRKINGATPKVIAFMFGRVYIIQFILAYMITYPLLRLLIIDMTKSSPISSVSGFSWLVRFAYLCNNGIQNIQSDAPQPGRYH